MDMEPQENILKNFPKFFFDEEGLNVGVKVSKEEVEHILSKFARDKSPELDGWQTEFYLHFFELMGGEINLVVNESHCLGKVPDSLNSTFLVLIPKKDRP